MKTVEMAAENNLSTSGTAHNSSDMCPSGDKLPLEVSQSRQTTAWTTSNNVIAGSIAVNLVATANGIRNVSGENWRLLNGNACCHAGRSGFVMALTHWQY
jgi:hypothetical protein